MTSVLSVICPGRRFSPGSLVSSTNKGSQPVWKSGKTWKMTVREIWGKHQKSEAFSLFSKLVGFSSSSELLVPFIKRATYLWFIKRAARPVHQASCSSRSSSELLLPFIKPAARPVHQASCSSRSSSELLVPFIKRAARPVHQASCSSRSSSELLAPFIKRAARPVHQASCSPRSSSKLLH